jgi:hypothetical protein
LGCGHFTLVQYLSLQARYPQSPKQPIYNRAEYKIADKKISLNYYHFTEEVGNVKTEKNKENK